MRYVYLIVKSFQISIDKRQSSNKKYNLWTTEMKGNKNFPIAINSLTYYYCYETTKIRSDPNQL